MLPKVEPFSDVCWERILKVHEDIAQRQARITQALKSAGVPYAIVGGQAVAAWVSNIDPAAVRSTKDVDILLDRSDLPRAKQAANPAGFEYLKC